MEVKIGVLHTAREIVLDVPQTPEEVEQAVAAALKSVDGRWCSSRSAAAR